MLINFSIAFNLIKNSSRTQAKWLALTQFHHTKAIDSSH